MKAMFATLFQRTLGGLVAMLGIHFKYTVEHIRNGAVIDREVVYNLVPTEGLNHILNTVLKAGAQATSWYVSIFEGNYTPTAGITAATFTATAGECTAYASATRPAWTGGTVSAGAVDNTAAKADFVMTADKTVYGGVLISASAKSSTSGVLISAVRFVSAKVLINGDTLRITAGLSLASS